MRARVRSVSAPLLQCLYLIFAPNCLLAVVCFVFSLLFLWDFWPFMTPACPWLYTWLPRTSYPWILGVKSLFSSAPYCCVFRQRIFIGGEQDDGYGPFPGSPAQGTYHQCQPLIATQGDGCQGLKQQWEREEVWDQSCNGILIMTESACGSSRPLSVTRHHFTVDPIHC